MRKDQVKRLLLDSSAICVILIAVIGAVDLIRYIWLGMLVPLVTLCMVELLLILSAVLAWQGKLPVVFLAPGICALVLGLTTNYLETTLFHVTFFLQAGVALLAAVVGTIRHIRLGIRPRLPHPALLGSFLLLLVSGLALWLGGTAIARNTTEVKREIWAVPARYDSPCAQAGTVEKLTYPTKAYATDQRDVEKTAYIYLPYGYDTEKRYNILYLMHGTGDDEAYWLITHPQNKRMVDQLIASGAIEPLIIVTPTFYVEDDCFDGLDPLTYSFAQELRNDLMPAVECRYATYAESYDPAGFSASRDHRAFAGLSRGAVTTYHSAFCSSLDYFSWFGTFSGSRTSADYFQETIQSEKFADLPIHYLYVSSGTFDFALPQQIREYQSLLAVEPRLREGNNTTFDVFPMRYHSIGDWHLALYNFLQKVFVP